MRPHATQRSRIQPATKRLHLHPTGPREEARFGEWMTLKCGGELRLHDLADELFGERCDSEVSYRLAEPRVALDDVHGANETACEGIRRGALTVSECDGRETLGDPWDVRPILSALEVHEREQPCVVVVAAWA